MENISLKDLYKLRDELKTKERKLYEIIYSEREDRWKFLASNEFEKLSNKLYVLNKKIFELDKIIMLKKDPLAFNEKIDLRKISSEIKDRYYIFLHNTDIDIGYIDYRGYHVSPIMGDIGYYIDEEYRGNGYAAYALKLLEEVLYKNDIDSIWVSVQEKNESSIKTIKKNSGILLQKYDNGILQYDCKTGKKKL